MTTDVIIVGGGVIGLLSALRLKQAGLSVEVFEKSDPATESSWAGLGVLSPEAAPGRHVEYIRLTQASLALYPALADEMRDASNVDVDLRREGLLNLALDDAGVAELHESSSMQARDGVPVTWLSASEVRALEPHLTDGVRGALHFTHSAQVDNLRLNSALIIALGHAGVPVHSWQTVTRITTGGGRVHGVRVGETDHAARWVVVAAGAWSGSLAGASMPVRPAKGQAAMLDASSITGFNVSHIVDSHLGYVVPRRNGRLLIGATVEDKGFDKTVDDEVVGKLMTDASGMMPPLREARVRETWAGLRPRSADDQPVLGTVAGCDGLIAATGHFRNGILLAPITAQLVIAWVTGQQPALDVARFSPNRFAAAEKA
jgi:glycine oxidase